jgi:hypothetical protein
VKIVWVTHACRKDTILFARPRSKSLFIQDLENFKKHFEQDELEVGGVAKDLVRNPQTEHTERKLPNFRGLSSFGSTYSDSKETSELYFPLPFNEEQVSIAQKLDCSNAVVVQGPPGTGKTHTIANIIAHYMALGKRVLVTSMKEPALSVLKEKLPEALQPLAISILTNEQEGMKQFEFAVSKIAQELQSLDKKKLENDIQGEERLVDQLHGKLNSIDRAITDWADANIKQILLDEKTIYPDEAAREVRSGEGNYEWLDDAITIAAKHAPQFDNNDVLKIREARRILGSDIVYLFAKFPEIDIFPEVIDLLQLHRDLMKYTEIDQLLKNNNYPSLVDGNEETFRKVESLIDAIANLEKNRKAVQNSAKSWASLMRERLQKADSAQVISIFENLLNEINECLVEKNLFLEKPILLPDNFELNEVTIQAITNKSQGKSAFGLTGIIGKGQLKKLINEIRIIGNKPGSTEDWVYILQ